MAYDYGSLDLGIRNPFKKEGLIRFIGGAAVATLGVIILFLVPQNVETDLFRAWVYAILGILLLSRGLHRAGQGLFKMFRFFVGRSAPTSLAPNFAKSERDNAKLEAPRVAYSASALENMLMGRKNVTFTEPAGWLSRMVHSIMPKLLFLPYPIRNIAQDIAGAVISTLTALIAFGLTYFVSASGLAGAAGEMIIPLFSVVLLVYLVWSWRKVARSIKISASQGLQDRGAGSLAKILAFSILIPVIIGALYSQLSVSAQNELAALTSQLDLFSATPYLLLMAVLAGLTIALTALMIRERTKQYKPLTEVSEYRQNLQESVHPNEIFVNIDNIVLANRRFREIPNRYYRELDPKLNEQSQGKGDFFGELIAETQPEYQPQEYSRSFNIARVVMTLLGQVLFFLSALALVYGAVTLSDLAGSYQELANQAQPVTGEQALSFFDQTQSLLALLFTWLILSGFGNILTNQAHVFWGEITFNSLLIYLKAEGTFTESKLSTGTSIYDSTRSENVVVRSSITSWIITSRITTSTFATSGANNLEMPRYIMSMQRNDAELEQMVEEIKGFLRNRESIASISNDRDLQSAHNIFQVNQQTRALIDSGQQAEAPKLGAEASHALSNNSDGFTEQPS